MSVVCLPVWLLLWCSAAENDWFLCFFLTRTRNVTSVKKSCLEMASVGIETLEGDS